MVSRESSTEKYNVKKKSSARDLFLNFAEKCELPSFSANEIYETSFKFKAQKHFQKHNKLNCHSKEKKSSEAFVTQWETTQF